jgi:transposase
MAYPVTGFLGTPMEVSDYQQFVDRELCWVDGASTFSSHATQKQCPKCRRKWNYLERRRRFDLLVAYAEGMRAGVAASACGASRNTAQNWFRKLDSRAADVVRRLHRRGGVTLVDEKVTFTTIRKLRIHSGKYTPHEAVGRAIFFNGLELRERIAHLIEPEIQEMAKRCLVALYGPNVTEAPGLAFLDSTTQASGSWRQRLKTQLIKLKRSG